MFASRSGTSRQAASTARGSNRGVGARFGPMPARPISAAARSALHDADGDRDAPLHAAERVEQMRRGRAERQRTDQDADHQSHVAPRPGGCELHPDRIHARHRDAGDDAKERRNEARRIDDEEQRVRDRARQRGQRR